MLQPPTPHEQCGRAPRARTRGIEVRGSGIQAHAQLPREFEAILGYVIETVSSETLPLNELWFLLLVTSLHTKFKHEAEVDWGSLSFPLCFCTEWFLPGDKIVTRIVDSVDNITRKRAPVLMGRGHLPQKP